MKSPKFKYVSPHLASLFLAGNLKNIWQGRVKQQLRDQAVSDLIEYRDHDINIETICKDVEGSILSATYRPNEVRTFLVEKSKGLCRQMTLVRPTDLLVLETLSRALSPALKKAAPTNKAYFEPNDGKFRAKVTESDYGSFASWKRFQKATLGFADECNYVVVTDVANFYDFINYHHLRNIIADCDGIKEPFLDLLIFVLRRLSWTPDYTPSQDIGMPQIEASAPRVLANAMLYEVDRLVNDASVANYARFMDDIDFGVDSVPQAKAILRDIDLVLQSRQLRLNASKTQIFRAKDAHHHFCVDENRYLQRLENLLPLVIKMPKRVAELGSKLQARHEAWWKKAAGGSPSPEGRYRRGNGGKLLKWTWRLMRKYGLPLNDEELLWGVRVDPALRHLALEHLSFSTKPHDVNREVLKFLQSGNVVDDMSICSYAQFLVNTRFKGTAKHKGEIAAAVEVMQRNNSVGLACAMQVLAKYGTPASIVKLANSHFGRLRRDFYAARNFAACYPHFLGSAESVKFSDLIVRLDNEAAESVFNFHHALHTDAASATKQYAFLKMPNPSLATHINLSKALMLLSAKGNSGFSAIYAKARAAHVHHSKDAYYAAMGL